MNTYIVLYNPCAANCHGKENTYVITGFLPEEELTFYDMTEIRDYGEFFSRLPLDVGKNKSASGIRSKH